MNKSTGIKLTSLALLAAGAVGVACSGTERLPLPEGGFDGIGVGGTGGMPPVAGAGGTTAAGAAGMPAAGAGGMPMPMETQDVEVCDAPTEVFAQGCGNFATCHGAGSMQTDFLSDPSRLIDILDAPSVRADCSASIVDTANPEASLLLAMVTGESPAGCSTVLMPPGNGLDDEGIACVRSWVAGQADLPPDAPEVAEQPPPEDPMPEMPPVAAAGCDRGLDILAQSCDGGFCHGDANTVGGNPFVELGQVQALLANGTAGSNASCGALFNGDDPAASAVVSRMRGECGALMPPGGPALPEEDIQCVTDWIGSL